MPNLYSYSQFEIHQIAFLTARGWLVDDLHKDYWRKEGSLRILFGDDKSEYEMSIANNRGLYPEIDPELWTLDNAYYEERYSEDDK